MSPRPLGYATVVVLRAVAEGHKFGFDVIAESSLASGTVYPALASLSNRGLLKARWESDKLARSEGRPRRRYYEVTPEGEAALKNALERMEGLGLGRPLQIVKPEPSEG